MPMSNVLSLLPPPFPSPHARRVLPTPRPPAGRERAGRIGPIRREIIFEPLPDNPVPAEPPPVTPEQPQEQPLPDRT
jgi:hypothetical protein